MAFASDKIMFEVYREAGYDARYRAVYFTELNEHNKTAEINRAMAGEHVLDGFLASSRVAEAKSLIASWLSRWDRGEPVDPAALLSALASYCPAS